MENNEIRILSTRPVDDSIIEEATAKGIVVDVISFIDTVAIDDDAIKNKIDRFANEPCISIFTSMNAVDAVIHQLQNKVPAWKIFCMGNTTRQLVENYFGASSIVATGSSASELANEIIDWKKSSEHSTPVIFFCGDQRRDELPAKLHNHGIELEEIVTYQTIETTHHIRDAYHGILFFSPSAVHSFFKTNTAGKSTTFFAIGETTANTINDYTSNKIVISETPSKDDLLRKAISCLVV